MKAKVPSTWWRAKVKTTTNTVTLTGAAAIDKPDPMVHNIEDQFNKEWGVSQKAHGDPNHWPKQSN